VPDGNDLKVPELAKIMTSDTLARLNCDRDAFDRLAAARQASDLRADLLRHYPGLDMRRLDGIGIVGAAGEGARLATLCREHGIAVFALVDDHAAKIGQAIASHTVQPVGSLQQLDRTTPIMIASHRVLGATERLRALGFQTVLPFAALQVLAPDRFPPHMFYDGLLDDLWNSRDRFARLNERLADARSRQVLNAVLAFRQTLDPVMLKPVLDDDDLYAPKGLIEFSDREVYVDGGSYDGDTIRTFVRRVGNRFEHVYAFEPDPVTYRVLQSNFAAEPRVEAIHSGLHREKGVLSFKDDGSRGAIFSADGTIEMPVTTLDDVVGQGRVSYIKMNIEGAEIDALHGGERLIRREHPKLALSVYHRPSDLWRIPEIVENFSSGYQLYLRQHDGGVIETVLYALHKQ
jgi:FkbM family methyltransferase